MTHRIRWGVIGSGGIARRRTIPEGIVPACNAELVGVYDVQSSINEAVAKEYGVHAASSVAQLLKLELDAIYIATPAYLHSQQVLECAHAGKHILCEKPLGLSVDEARSMIETCRNAGVALGTGLMMRFHSQHQAALTMIRDGKIGQPVYGRAQLSCWYPPIENAWRQNPEQGGGGSLIDMGGHCIDLLEMFFGPVAAVGCMIRNSVHSYRPEDSAAVLLQFERGTLASVDTFFCIPDTASQNRLELYGSRGSILAQGTIGQGEAGIMTAFLEPAETDYDAAQARAEGGGIAIAPEPVNMYRAEIEEFGAAILEGREPSHHAGLGLRNQQILTACYESARTGKTVPVE